MVARLGGRLPLHATGVGKVLLAFAPEDVRKQVLGNLYRVRPPTTVTEPGRLLGQLRRVHREGFAHHRGDEPGSVLGGRSHPDSRSAWVVATVGVVVRSLEARPGQARWQRWPGGSAWDRSRAQVAAASTQRKSIVAVDGPVRLTKAVHGPSSVVTGATIGIVGGGPAGLMLSHLLSLSGIDSVVVDNRPRLEIEQTVRAGILERDSVRLLVESGVSDRVLREVMNTKASTLAFAGSGHPHRLSRPDRLVGLALPADRCLHRPCDLARETRKVRPAMDRTRFAVCCFRAICKRKMQGHWVNDRAHYRMQISQ